MFQRIFKENMLGSAYCFYGKEGIGKDAFALEIAKVANCEHPIIRETTYSACDECKSCKMANTMNHPAIRYVFAQPKEIKDEVYENIKAELHLFQKDRYHKINIANSREIHIDLIRSVIRQLSVTTDYHNFVVISDGHKMNDSAANSFLKTLEDPPSNTTLLITTSRKDALLPTILSRCQQMYFPARTNEEINEYLWKQHHRRSKLVAEMAQGSIKLAVDLISDNINSMRNEVVDILRIALKRRGYRVELLAAIEDFLRNYSKDVKWITYLLNLLLVWLRDVYTVSSLYNEEKVINTDLTERIMAFSKGYRNANVFEAIEKVERTIFLVNRNVDAKLALLGLFIEMRKVFLESVN
jgi:DNA polymerase-3 subunit delta'